MTTLRLAAAFSLVAASLPISARTPVLTTTGASPTSAGASITTLSTGTRANGLTTIQGNALTSTNGPLAGVVVRLRDARYGKIVDRQRTDASGLFTFRGVEPGSYIVEVMAE